MPDWLIAPAIIAAVVAAGWMIGAIRDGYRYRRLKPRLDGVDAAERDLQIRQQKWQERMEADEQAIQQIASEKSVGFPWLAEAYADYFYLRDMREARNLETKKHPARKAAESVREVAGRRRDSEKLRRVLAYQLKYYEALFPWLEEFRQDDIDDLVVQIVSQDSETSDNDEDDKVKRWLTEAEYRSLPAKQRNQVALDRYWSRKKSSWEIGRDYERYIGYRYESAGATVNYHGIFEGMADLGRDLIVSMPNGQIEVVQCKYWSKHKLIHEKHIFQLYGTVVAYRIDQAALIVNGVFYTSTLLSDRAKQFAHALGIKYFELETLQAYPAIKCNVSERGKIYHLPFDQQYDRTLIRERNERYVATVEEAERRGFRRAHRWKGGSKADA